VLASCLAELLLGETTWPQAGCNAGLIHADPSTTRLFTV